MTHGAENPNGNCPHVKLLPRAPPGVGLQLPHLHLALVSYCMFVCDVL
jgi:hypothetical protein